MDKVVKVEMVFGPFEARQWFPPGDPRHVPIDGVLGRFLYKNGDFANVEEAIWFIKDGYGKGRLDPGDWVIKKDGDTVDFPHFDIASDADFQKKYRQVQYG